MQAGIPSGSGWPPPGSESGAAGVTGADTNTTVLCFTPAAQVGSGDADCNGAIEQPDIPVIVEVIFGAADCGSGFQAADVNTSGEVNARDLATEMGYLHDPL